jgi:alpha-mannosidase
MVYGIDTTWVRLLSMIRALLLVPHTHHDVGCTSSPRIVELQQVTKFGEVLRLAQTGAEPGPGQFHWMFEVA